MESVQGHVLLTPLVECHKASNSAKNARQRKPEALKEPAQTSPPVEWNDVAVQIEGANRHNIRVLVEHPESLCCVILFLSDDANNAIGSGHAG